MSGMTQAALEMRKALQFFVGTMDADTQLDMMLEIPSVFPAYSVGVGLQGEGRVLLWHERRG